MIIGLARNLILSGWIDRFHQLFIDNALRNTHQLEFYDRFHQDTSRYAHVQIVSRAERFRIKAYSSHLQTRIYYQREKPVTRDSIDAFYLQGKVCRGVVFLLGAIGSCWVAIDGGNLNGAHAVNETVSISNRLLPLVNNSAFARSGVA